MTIKQTAKDYIDLGWQVVPVLNGEKRANTKWQSKVYTPDDFPDDAGIAGKCGEPSGWRVDVDLDHPLAVEIAPLFLPSTQLVHGRPGKPNSHWWYLCEDIKTRQFTGLPKPDGSKQMLVEIRSTGGYTVLPPSVHPSGDVLGWAMQREPMRLDPDELTRPVTYIALATLMAIHWPGPGARHAMVGHLAGFLLKCGVAPTFVPRIIEAAAIGARDGDLHDRMNFVRATVQKYTDDQDATMTGGPKLAEVLGKDVVAKMRSWLGVADDDAIEEMNAKHFVARLGKDEVIGRDDGPVVIFQQPRALAIRYANVKVKTSEKINKKTGEVTDQFKPLFYAWLESPNRRAFENVVFCPPPQRADDRDYNLWKGFAVKAAPGDCSLFMSHIHNIICSGNEEHTRYLLNLLALTMQEPGTPSGVAVVLRGDQGTGKGIFVRTLGEIFGRQHYIQLDNVKHLVGNFNAAISGKVIVFADEAFWAGNKASVGALKRLITEPTLTIERKGIDVALEDNHVHLFMATNEDWAIPAGLDERRFFALHVSSAHKQDAAYFQALRNEIENGGRAAFLHEMLTWPVDRVALRTVPRTAELRNQQDRSLSPLLEWWQDCLYEGVLPNPYVLGWPDGEWVPVPPLYQSYKEWVEHRKQYPLSNVKFALDLKAYAFATEITPKNIKRDLQSTDKGIVRCGLLKPLADARKYFDSRLGTETTWPEVDATQQALV